MTAAHVMSPLPYQMEGADFLAGRKAALLADEMGLGKSCQAIRAADILYARRILVLCPAVARQNWLNEFHKFSYVPRTQQAIFSADEPITAELVIVSYDLAIKMYDALTAEAWDVVICDEGHFLKSRQSERTQVVYGGFKLTDKTTGTPRVRNGLIKHTRYLWVLSGTPAPNHAAELYPMLNAFGLTDGKSYWDFLNYYCNWYETNYGVTVTGTKQKRLEQLKNLLAPIMLRRKKADVMPQLPPITWSELMVEAGPVDKLLYFADPSWPTREDPKLDEKLALERQMMEHTIKSFALGEPGLAALATQAVSLSTLRKWQAFQKAPGIVEWVKNEMESGLNKLVIFGYHRQFIEYLEMELKAYDPVTVYGGTPPRKRDNRIQRFQNNYKCRIFIGQLDACGTAITLTSADSILIAETDWVPAKVAQAVMRVHRIGQKNPVTARFAMLAGDSIDQRIQNVLRRKTMDLAAIFD